VARLRANAMHQHIAIVHGKPFRCHASPRTACLSSLVNPGTKR
jgi:hypothetical protein